MLVPDLRVCCAPATLLQALTPGRDTSLIDSLGSREVIDNVIMTNLRMSESITNANNIVMGKCMNV